VAEGKKLFRAPLLGLELADSQEILNLAQTIQAHWLITLATYVYFLLLTSLCLLLALHVLQY
jgi:hypothetical protein